MIVCGVSIQEEIHLTDSIRNESVKKVTKNAEEIHSYPRSGGYILQKWMSVGTGYNKYVGDLLLPSF